MRSTVTRQEVDSSSEACDRQHLQMGRSSLSLTTKHYTTQACFYLHFFKGFHMLRAQVDHCLTWSAL